MSKKIKKRIGIFLGRLQPQHAGHEAMIGKIFDENDEVVLCIGSAQHIPRNHPEAAKNPYPVLTRRKKLEKFLRSGAFTKPWRIASATDIRPESAWPDHLKGSCGLDDTTVNTVYFADPISDEYRRQMESSGFRIKRIRRRKFLYETRAKVIHKISSATEIRSLENVIRPAIDKKNK